MVLAAGLGTRLRPLTYELPKPMVPVLDRPVMAYTVELLARSGFGQPIANLHYFPDTIRDYFGDRLEYSYEPELLGTAGGVRNCRDHFGSDPFLIISGDALTDIDLNAFVERHRSCGGIATLAVKRVTDTSEYGVVIHDSEGRIAGFQEKPQPAEALSDLGNCGIYIFEPEIFDYFPDTHTVDWANDVFPTLLENDVPFYIHEIDNYWNDVGSLGELLQGTFDLLSGELDLPVSGREIGEGVKVGEGTELYLPEEAIEPPIWIGQGVEIGEGVRLQGPLAIGDGAVIGKDSALKGSVVLPGTRLADSSITVGAIVGHKNILGSLKSFG